MRQIECMSTLIKLFLFLCLLWFAAGCSSRHATIVYNSKPWQQQTIPGKIECEFYDKGGEGVAYHDSDIINNGSGKLNPANGTYLNEFRMKEGVDISYTKSSNVDNNSFNKQGPDMNQLYVGWTKVGEWIRYTINVKETATYNMALIYTANGNSAISLDIDQMQNTSSLQIPSTYNDADTVAWRQWHHWNKIDSLTSINLKKGRHVLTLHVVDNGNMNFDYLEFVKR